MLEESTFSFSFNSSDNVIYPNYTTTHLPLNGTEYSLPTFTEDQVTATYPRLEFAITADFFPSFPCPQPPFTQSVPSVTCRLYASLDVSGRILFSDVLLAERYNV